MLIFTVIILLPYCCSEKNSKSKMTFNDSIQELHLDTINMDLSLPYPPIEGISLQYLYDYYEKNKQLFISTKDSWYYDLTLNTKQNLTKWQTELNSANTKED